MKTEILCCTIGVMGGIIGCMAFNIYVKNAPVQNQISKCLLYKDTTRNTLQQIFQEKLPSNYVLNISSLSKSFELSESPAALGTKLYNEIKGGAICDSIFNVIIKNTKTNTEFKDIIEFRYQIVSSVFPDNFVGVRVSKEDMQHTQYELNQVIEKDFEKDLDVIYNTLLTPKDQIAVNIQNWDTVDNNVKYQAISKVIKVPQNIEKISNCVSRATKLPTSQAAGLQEVILSCDKVVNQLIPEQESQQPKEYIDANVLLTQLHDNVIAFDKAYNNKELLLIGDVMDIGTNFITDEGYVVLVDKYEGVRCYPKDTDQLINIKKGQSIKVRGTYKKGVSAGNTEIILKDCVIE